jgi:hypothetical protein
MVTACSEFSSRKEMRKSITTLFVNSRGGPVAVPIIFRFCLMLMFSLVVGVKLA